MSTTLVFKRDRSAENKVVNDEIGDPLEFTLFKSLLTVVILIQVFLSCR